MPPPESSPALTLEFDADVTLADQLRFAEWLIDQPPWRRKRLLIQAGMLVTVPPLSILLGATTFSFQDHKPLGPTLLSTLSDPGALQILLEVAGLLLTYFIGQRVARRPILRRRLRKLLSERPGVDPADPSLSERSHVAISPAGFSSATPATRVELAWPAIKSLHDAGSILTLMQGRLTGFIIPKRGLTELQAETLKTTILANIEASRCSATSLDSIAATRSAPARNSL